MKRGTPVLLDLFKRWQRTRPVHSFHIERQQEIISFEIEVEKYFDIKNWNDTWNFIKEKIIELPISFSMLHHEIYGYFDAWRMFGIFVCGQKRYNQKNFFDMVEAISKIVGAGGRDAHGFLPIVFNTETEKCERIDPREIINYETMQQIKKE